MFDSFNTNETISFCFGISSRSSRLEILEDVKSFMSMLMHKYHIRLEILEDVKVSCSCTNIKKINHPCKDNQMKKKNHYH